MSLVNLADTFDRGGEPLETSGNNATVTQPQTYPATAIRRHCVWCCGGSITGASSPIGCNSPSCSLYRWRLGSPSKLPPAQAPPAEPRPFDAPPIMRQRAATSRLAAIRLRCLDCVGSSNEAKRCVKTTCDLWPYRLGKNPARHGIGRKDFNALLTGVPGAPDASEGLGGTSGRVGARTRLIGHP